MKLSKKSLNLLTVASLALGLVGHSAQAKEMVVNEDLAYHLTESLVTQIGPRMPGTKADARTVEWAVDKFERLGYDRVWTEEFAMQHWQPVSASLHVQAPFKQDLVLASLGHSISTPEQGIQASVVEFDSLESLREAEPSDVEGKIVFINREMERHPRGATYGPAVSGRSQGAVVASELGAVAVLIRSISTSDDRFPHTGMMRYQDGIEKIPAAALSVPDANQLSRMLQREPELTVDFNLQNESKGEVTSHNVIAEMRGTERPDELILIGAHHDSWHKGTGALDDGAGVGIVMATGAMVRQRGETERTVRVVLFGAEEIGLVGARAYTDKHADNLHNHIFASESDFGAGRVFAFDTNFGEEGLEFADEVHKKLLPLGIQRGHNNASGGPDITFLQQEGVPVGRLQQDGTDYFDYHHTNNDTLDKVDPAAVKQNLRAWVILTEALANSDVNLRD
ncbi:peptidase M28 family protein [Aliidiomarina minuta]|uniref:Carboxypeptidase Q n=1 Tax=Aliidiomarina minuta TaxID=880057 RepID=A0A432W4R1_9GAMM|nr:M28 family peptidase [Aliidiomarina minuta]RUO24478.1 peptidase M28 family protein [Aliidiomarina minuta]